MYNILRLIKDFVSQPQIYAYFIKLEINLIKKFIIKIVISL